MSTEPEDLEPEAGPEGAPQEEAPSRPSRTPGESWGAWMARIRAWQREHGGATKRQATGERPAKKSPARRRVSESAPKVQRARRNSLAPAFSWVWQGMGTGLVMTGRDRPVGSAMVVESRLAGRQLDSFVAGSFLDKILQPFASKGDSAKGLGVVLGFPLMVGLLERRPELAPTLRPLGAFMMQEILIEIGKIPKEEIRRVAEAEQAAQSLEMGMGYEELVTAFFGPDPRQTAPESPSPDTEAA